MSNLSELLPAGAGAKSASFVASGTLGSGVTVALKSDGTVGAVNATGGTVEQGVGSRTTFNTGSTIDVEVAYDIGNNKFVFVYADFGNSSYGTAVVGTVSGTSISFGTEVVFESGSVRFSLDVVYDSYAGKVVVVFEDFDASSHGKAIVGTVSGTSISFGSPTTFNSGATDHVGCTFDSTNNKVVVCYENESNSNYGTARVGTVSGTSISFGSATVFASATTTFIAATYASASGKVVFAYTDDGNSSRGTAIVGTVSGTSISFGSEATYHSVGATDENSIAYDSDTVKVIVACRFETGSDYGIAYVGTISGTAISFGSSTTFNAGTTNEMKLVYDPNAELITVFYRDGSAGSNIYANTGTVSGSTITWGTEFRVTPFVSTGIGAAYDSNSKQIGVGYRQNTSGDPGVGLLYRNAGPGTNNTDFIGITDQAIANTATGAVIVQGGVSEKVTGLTTGSDYYVQDDGSLSTTVSSVPAGRALSSTSILLEG
jgi:hypothetical protein